MFGKKREDGLPTVPVFTVHTLPRKYEVLKTVYGESKSSSGDNYVACERLLTLLGELGASARGDAVIGLTLYPSGYYGHTKGHLLGFGTVVKYLD